MNVIAESMQRTDSAAAELELVSASRRGRWLRRLLLLAVFCGLLFALRHPLMSLAAWLWIVNDPPEKADAVLVLGGGMDSRPFAAADFYRRGLAPLVLVADTSKSPAVKLKVAPQDTEVARGILRKLGVPDSAVQSFGNEVTSTREEAAGLRQWLEQHPVKRLIIPTDPFHTRRVRYIFERELRGTGVQLTVTSISNDRYDPLAWWKSEEATLHFQNEGIKLAYYWLN